MRYFGGGARPKFSQTNNVSAPTNFSTPLSFIQVRSTHSLSHHPLVLERVLHAAMSVSQSQTIETEEDLLPCLHMRLYHPQQSHRNLYGLLPLDTRSRHAADDPLTLGRDGSTCTFAILDPRVSRKQLALHAYRTPHCADTLFTIQNLSRRGQLSVNSSALGFLEKTELPDKALVRFGHYELLIEREFGEAQASFEVGFEVLAVPPSRETCLCTPTGTAVTDTGSGSCVLMSYDMRGPSECAYTPGS